MDTSKTFKRIHVLPSKPTAVPVLPGLTATVTGSGLQAPLVAPIAKPPKPQKPTSMRLPKLSKDFLLAGRALFTVDNGKGEHYTYKVRAKENEFRGRMVSSFFVSVKAVGGPFPYRYIGLLNPADGTIKCTAKSNFLPGTKEYDVAAWACQSVIKSKMIPTNYQIEHAGKCGRCGRTLTDPESIARGIGPECWTILGH